MKDTRLERRDGLRSTAGSMPRPRSFLLLGASLALGVPVGLVIVEALAAGEVPTLAWALEDIAKYPVTYVYVALSTVVVFVVLASVLGGRSTPHVASLRSTKRRRPEVLKSQSLSATERSL